MLSRKFGSMALIADPAAAGAANGLDKLMLEVLFTAAENGGLEPRPNTILVVG